MRRLFGRYIKPCAAILVLLWPTLVSSEEPRKVIWEPPEGFQNTVHSDPTVSKEYIASLRVSGATVVLDETTLEQARETLGGTIGHRGDAADRHGYYGWKEEKSAEVM